MEQGSYAQVVMICQKEKYNKKENDITNKYNFQWKSGRSIRSFNIDHECLEEKFSTLELNVY